MREFPVVNPLAVKVNARAPIKLDAKAAAAFDLAGKIERFGGAAGEVALTRTGLPPGATGPATATVKNGATDFKFALKLPVNLRPGDYPALKISATGKPFGPLQVRIEATVTLKVLPPDPLPASP